MKSGKVNPAVTVVCPVYNNAAHLAELTLEIRKALAGIKSEIIYIDDGSADASWQAIQAMAKTRQGNCVVRGIKLSKNFGQHMAILAGLRAANLAYIVVLDADGQDDPSFIPQMIARAREGFDIVHTRRLNQKKTWRGIFSELVYRILSWSSEIRRRQGMGTYKLITRRALMAALPFVATQPLFEIMVSRAGFRSSCVDIVRRKRPAGNSTYGLGGWTSLIINLMVTYSSLVFAVFLGSGFAFLAAGILGFFLSDAARSSHAAVLSATGFLSGLILVVGGVLGYYIRALQTAERRWPHYIVEETI